jgi:hypothetical protein
MPHSICLMLWVALCLVLIALSAAVYTERTEAYGTHRSTLGSIVTRRYYRDELTDRGWTLLHIRRLIFALGLLMVFACALIDRPRPRPPGDPSPAPRGDPVMAMHP